MSERGSFITEYIYCDKCFNAAKRVLLRKDSYLYSIVLPFNHGRQKMKFPIIAGKIGGLYMGEEKHLMEYDLIPELSKTICHKVRIAVLAENGEQIFTAIPARDK